MATPVLNRKTSDLFEAPLTTRMTLPAAISSHLGLSRRSRREVTAAQALVLRHSSDMNLLSLQRASKQNR
jgi:hypothetical protein